MEQQRMFRKLFALALVATAACGPHVHVKNPSAALSRFDQSEKIVIGFELTPGCKLQEREGAAPPGPKGWTEASAQAYANKTFTVHDRKTMISSAGNKELVSGALQLEDRAGRVFWMRNVPAASVEDAAASWSCAFDADTVQKAMPALHAGVVRLTATSAECTSIAPIFGSVEGLTFAPYTVTARSLFSVKKTAVIGVRLEADGGEKVITVSGSALDKCFVPADKAPPPPAEVVRLREWLEGAAADSTPPPPVSDDTVTQLMALQRDRCLKEGTGVLTHYECRTPILRIAPTKTAGPYGPPIIRLVRERVVDAVHLYAGHLVPSQDIVAVNAAVRLGKLGAGSFARNFNDELEKSLLDPPMRLKRAANGFRLLRTADVSAGVPATHHVDIDLSFNVPDVDAKTEHRVHKYVAGKKTMANPAYATAEQAVEAAKEEVASAKKAAAVVEAGTKAAAEAASDACKKGGDKIGYGLGFLSGALCKSGTNAVGEAAEREILKKAIDKLSEAETKLAATSKTTSVDDTQEYGYDAKVYRRSGDAIAKIAITASGQSQVQAGSSITFHFEASDDEYPGSAEHKLPAKTARVPTSSDVEKQLAHEVLARVDEAVIRWGAQRQVGGDIGELQPGTRSWMVAVARHAASDRNVKLLSDLLERRADALEKEAVTYPIKMPEKVDGRCFTFAAIPLEPTADVNLELGRVLKGEFAPLAIDVRPAADAGFEVCDMPSAEYALRLTHGKKASKKGVLVSMFDSTPGGPTAEDTVAGSKGIPTMARKGEQLVLNGEGVVQFRGTNNKVVVGKTGDRDGDGIPDDEDRCPYDPETMNGYLDDDGCPDVAPEGFVPPASFKGPTGGKADPPAAGGGTNKQAKDVQR
jgi:hypothetical protein